MTGVTQLCEVRSFWDLAVVSAMADSGLLGAPARRVLVVANTAAVPEAAGRVQDAGGFARLADRFDAVIDYNATIHPLHPTQWRPRPAEEPAWERALRALWGLGDGPVEVVAENVHSAPGLSLGLVFADARVSVYCDSPLALAATPRPLPVRLGHRLDRMLHLDLVPGEPPRALAEWGLPAVRLDRAAVRRTQREAGLGALARWAWHPALARVRGGRAAKLARGVRAGLGVA